MRLVLLAAAILFASMSLSVYQLSAESGDSYACTGNSSSRCPGGRCPGGKCIR